MNHRTLILASALCLALLPACKRDTAPAGGADSATGMQGAIEQVAQDADDAGALPGGDAPLKPGQSIQGVIEADVGQGTQRYRSLATKVADDIGQQVDEKIATSQGGKAIDDANRKLEALGVDARMSGDSVREIVGGMAGKTFADSEVRKLDVIHALQVTLKGTAGDGGHLDLGITFDDKSMALTGSSLSYRPKANAMFDFYQSKDKDGVQVTIDRFERNADGTYAIAGSFSAKDLPASSMAKKLPSASLPSASGTFSFDALPLKEMPKFGG